MRHADDDAAPPARSATPAAGTQGMVLAFWAGEQPGTPAIASQQGDRTFAELNANANRLVRALRRGGWRRATAWR